MISLLAPYPSHFAPLAQPPTPGAHPPTPPTPSSPLPSLLSSTVAVELYRYTHPHKRKRKPGATPSSVYPYPSLQDIRDKRPNPLSTTMAGKMLRFSALALLGGAAANYVEYSTYMNDDCATVLSTTVYTGVPCKFGVARAILTVKCREALASQCTLLNYRSRPYFLLSSADSSVLCVACRRARILDMPMGDAFRVSGMSGMSSSWGWIDFWRAMGGESSGLVKNVCFNKATPALKTTPAPRTYTRSSYAADFALVQLLHRHSARPRRGFISL